MESSRPPFFLRSSAGDVAAPMCPPMLDPSEGLAGRIKVEPEDFQVVEVPAYEPSGEGEHLFLTLEKTDVSASQLKETLASHFGIKVGEVGMAGLKDRRAVTRQLVSIPASCESLIGEFEVEGIRVLDSRRHQNKLKTGHLKGNQFVIRVRDVDAARTSLLDSRVESIQRYGVPNYYGNQRFGRDGSTASDGMRMIETLREPGGKRRVRRGHRLRFGLSAVQSLLFNDVLSARLERKQIESCLPGDVLIDRYRHWNFQVVEDVPAGNQLLEDRSHVVGGPIFGPRMCEAAGDARELEEQALDRFGVTHNDFKIFSKLTPGSRRPFMQPVDDLGFEIDGSNVVFRFGLPSGTYATVVLRELMGPELVESGHRGRE